MRLQAMAIPWSISSIKICLQYFLLDVTYESGWNTDNFSSRKNSFLYFYYLSNMTTDPVEGKIETSTVKLQKH